MRTILLDGKIKVGVIQETPGKVLVVALEDAIIKDVNNRMQMMSAGNVYAFCRCCYERRLKEVAKT